MTEEQKIKKRIRNQKYNKKHKKQNRAKKLQRKYGLTESQYNKIFVNQKGLCAICNQPEILKIKGKLKPLCVDHCHETSNIRKLLCSLCNVMLGMAKDNSDILRKAANYIDSFKDK
jgi:hypothetical protein